MSAEEIQAAMAAFQILEPEVQKGIAALIHHFDKSSTQKPLTPQEFIQEAEALLAASPNPTK